METVAEEVELALVITGSGFGHSGCCADIGSCVWTPLGMAGDSMGVGEHFSGVDADRFSREDVDSFGDSGSSLPPLPLLLLLVSSATADDVTCLRFVLRAMCRRSKLQIADIDATTAAQCQRPLKDIFQFTNIAAPQS